MPIDPRSPPYNAAWDGSTDDTAAITACCAGASGVDAIAWPLGPCKISGPIPVNAPISASGISEHESTFVQANPAADVFQINTAAPCHFEKFGAKSGGAGQTAGAMIRVGTASVINQESTFERLRFAGVYDAIVFMAAAFWSARRIFVDEFASSGITVQNVVTAESGDNTLIDFTAKKAGTGGTALVYTSSGGLKFNVGKLLGGDRGVFVDVPAGEVMSDFIMSGVSVESQAVACLDGLLGAGANLLHASIVGNQFAPNPVTSAVRFRATGASKLIQDTSLAHNIITLETASVALDLDGMGGFNASHNVVRGVNGCYGVQVGPNVGPQASCYVGKNRFSGNMAANQQYVVANPSLVTVDP